MNKEPMFKIGDKVKIRLDKASDEFKSYTGVYKVIDVKRMLSNGEFYYEIVEDLYELTDLEIIGNIHDKVK